MPPSTSRSPILASASVRRRVVAGFLILSGAGSLVTVALPGSTLRLQDGAHLAIRLPLVVAVPFTLVFLAGILLWTRHRLGVRAAVLALVPQVVTFHIPDGFDFKFSSGVAVLIGVLGFDPTFIARAGATLPASSSNGDWSFMINVVAVTALLLLLPDSIWHDEGGPDGPAAR